jgi:cytidine deaminase
MNTNQEQQLIEAACRVRQQAHAKYSGFLVGAALQTTDGTFLGCNVENASYGLTICAERVAAFNAIAAGARHFQQLVIAAPHGAPPCGACRQVLAEFCDDLPILLVDVDRDDHVTRISLAELLPHRFQLP